MARGRGRSLYKGLRLTATQNNVGTVMWSLSAKPPGAGWDEWKPLVSGTEFDSPSIESTEDALALLLMLLSEMTLPGT